MEEESNGELAFLETWTMQRSLYWYIGGLHILTNTYTTLPNTYTTEYLQKDSQYLHYSSHHQTSCKEKAVSSLFNTVYSIISNKDDFSKKALEQIKC